MKGCPQICRRASAQSQSSKASAESYCIPRIVKGQLACSSRKGGIVVALLYVVDRQRQHAKPSEPTYVRDLLTWIGGAVKRPVRSLYAKFVYSRDVPRRRKTLTLYIRTNLQTASFRRQ